MAFLNTRDAVEHDQSAETHVEAEIREFVRRDVVTNPGRQPENDSELVASSINSVLQRATATLRAGDRQSHHGAADIARQAAQRSGAGPAQDR